MSIEVPPAFTDAVGLRDGALGEQWLTTLPGLVDDLLGEWTCTRDGAVRHGQVGIVVPVIAPEGPAVIKISPPCPENAGEAGALRTLAGRAAVRLHRHDPVRMALLLERADSPPPPDVLDPEESVEMLATFAARIAVPGGVDATPLARTAGPWWEGLDRAAAGRPGLVAPAGLARARAAIDLAADDRTGTVLHGDLHEGNVLGADREPWLVIDPKGLTGSAAYDAWTVSLTRIELAEPARAASLLERRVERFARIADVDPDLANELAFARLVGARLWESAHGDRADVGEFLRTVLEAWH